MNNKQAGLPNEQVKTTGLESLEQAPASTVVTSVNSSQKSTSAVRPTQKRPGRPWKKQAVLLVVVLFFVSGLSFAALRLNKKIQKSAANQDLASSYKPVNNPVLGSESLIPVQSLNDKTVTINGDLTVQGKLNLSAQALNDLAGILGNTVRLTPALGGPAQAGNINVSGGVVASTFQGNGSNLSDLNASSIIAGTLSNERLDASVTRLGQTIPLSALQTTVLSSLNGISSNGAASIIGSGSVSISTDINTGTITVNGSTGGLSEIVAGTGLTGGGSIGSVTLDVDSGIVTMQGNTFNGANQLVKLNGSGELPVISATNLTNLNASNISSGTVADARLSANVTMQGNTFNGNSQLVKLNNAGELPALSATNLTNLNASNIGVGTLNDARLGANVTLQGNTFNLANKLVKLDNSGNLPALNGSAVTNLNASNISSGTVADARLSANVALLTASQTFSGNVVFTQPLTVNVIQPSAAMTIGATNQVLTLQGDLSTKISGTGGTGSVSLGFTGTPVGNVVYQLDAAAPAGTYTLCTTVGNCAGSGTGVTSLGGTTNRLAKFTGGQAIDDSSISDDGTLVTVGANGLYKAGADSTTAFRVQNAAGSTNIFTVDSTNTRVAIGQSTAGYTLDVNGDINSATGLRVGGNLVCDTNGCAASGSSGFYIQNSATTQTAANFNIESTSTSTPTAVLKLKTSQTADLLQARDASSNVIAKIDASGNISTTGQFQVNGTQISSASLSNDANLAKLNGAQTFTAANLFRNAGDSTTSFRIQNAAASNLFVADTSNTRIAIGQATAGYTLDVNGDINISSGNSYRINGVAICGPTATCAPSSGSSNYLQNGLTVQTANMNIQSASSSSVVAIVQGATGQTADLLQARDSNNNVVAKITSTGAIYQGANQVCDSSNNCNFALGSGSGNYIQNGTSTQTANMNIQSASTTSPTAVIQGANAQTADILQVKDGTSAGNTLFAVNQTTSNLISNPSFEVNTAGWSPKGSATISRSTAQKLYGDASLAVAFTGANGDGATFAYNLAPATSYTLSMSVYMTATGQYTNPIYSSDGTTQTGCATYTGTANTWQRFVCGFTTSSVSGTTYIGLSKSFASAGIAYIDGVQLETGTSGTNFQQGQISLNGVVNSQTVYRNSTNSNTAFQIQNSAGANMLIADTVNSRICIASCQNSTPSMILDGSGLNFSNISNSSTKITQTNNGLQFGIGNGGYSGVQIAGTSNYTGNLFNIQSGSTTSAILNINQSNTNLITNPSFDTDTTGWAITVGGSSLLRITTDQYSGASSVRNTNTATANTGGKFNYQLAASTTYSFSMYAKAESANFSTLELGYNTDGTTYTSCLTAQTVTTVGWTRYTCTFTMPSTVSSTRFVYFRQTDATARSFLVDAFQLEAASAPTAYSLGNISLNGNINSPAVFKNQSNSSTAFQIQNANGASILNVDTSVAGAQNLIVNPSFDSNTVGWSGNTAATISRTLADQYSGTGALVMLTTAAVNDGARYMYQLAASTTYTFSIYTKGSSGGFSANLGYSADGTTLTTCLASTGISATLWQRKTCTFTTPSSVSGNRFVYIGQTDSFGRTFYADLAQLEVGSSATNALPGALSINGAISTPLLLQGAGNSSNAFQVQNVAGTALFTVSTSNSSITLGTGAGSANPTVIINDAARIQNVIVGGTDGASTLRGATGSGGTINLQNTAAQSFAFTSYANTSATNVFQFNATPSSTAENLLQVQRNGTAVATVGNSGSLLLKNQSDTNAAFQIQNAAGTTALNINTGVNNATWNTGTSLGTARRLSGAVTYNNRAYAVGGIGSSNLNSVEFASLNGDGTMGAWTTTTGFTTARYGLASFAYNGYLYVAGGQTSGSSYQSDVQYAPIYPNGTIGTWNTTTTLPETRAGMTMVASGGYVYMLGGHGVAASSSGTTTVYSAPLNGNGTIGSWTAITSFATARTYAKAIIYNNFLYLLGGSPTASISTGFTDVQYAALNGNGTIGSWLSGSAMLVGRAQFAMAESGNKLYVAGGGGSTNLSDAYYTTFNGDGSLGSWTAVTSMSASRHQTNAYSTSSYFYVSAGSDGSGAVSDTRYISTTTQSYTNALTFNGLLNNTGPASFQNTTDSTSAFSIQNSASASIFQVDTANSRVGIGNSTPGNLLSVGALTLADSDAQLAVGTGGDTKKGIVIQAVAGQSADLLQAQDSTGSILASIDFEGNLFVKNITFTGHIVAAGPTPSVEIPSNGVGGDGTGNTSLYIFGTDASGVVGLFPGAGSNPNGTGEFIRITFDTPYSNFFSVQLTPMSDDAALLVKNKGVYASPDGLDGFTINVAEADLQTEKSYTFSYSIIEIPYP